MGATKYSETEKRRACAEFAVLGDVALVADKTGVRKATLQAWTKTAWWKDMLHAMHSANTGQIIAKANRALSHALDELEDRLEYGDVHVIAAKDGPQQYRAPIKARDLSTIINVLATRSEKAAEIASSQTQNYQLADLQASFRQFAQSYRTKQAHDLTAIEHDPIPDQQQDNHRPDEISGEGRDSNDCPAQA